MLLQEVSVSIEARQEPPNPITAAKSEHANNAHGGFIGASTKVKKAQQVFIHKYSHRNIRVLRDDEGTDRYAPPIPADPTAVIPSHVLLVHGIPSALLEVWEDEDFDEKARHTQQKDVLPMGKRLEALRSANKLEMATEALLLHFLVLVYEPDPEDDIEELNRQGFELEFVLPTNSKPSETASGADDFLSAVVSFPCRFFAMRAMARSYTHPFVLPEQQRDSEALATRSHVDLSQQSETEALDQVRAGTQPAAPIEEEAAEMQEGRSEARGRTFWLRCEWKLVESEAVRGRLLLAGFKIEPAEEQIQRALGMWGPHVVEGSMAASYQQDKGYFQAEISLTSEQHAEHCSLWLASLPSLVPPPTAKPPTASASKQVVLFDAAQPSVGIESPSSPTSVRILRISSPISPTSPGIQEYASPLVLAGNFFGSDDGGVGGGGGGGSRGKTGGAELKALHPLLQDALKTRRFRSSLLPPSVHSQVKGRWIGAETEACMGFDPKGELSSEHMHAWVRFHP